MDLIMGKNTGNRHYYAEFCKYGSKVISDGDTLMRFETREERDEIVKRINETNQSIDEKAIAVNLSSVSHRYDVRKFDTDECDEVYGMRTCAGRPFFEIRHRPSFQC